MSEQVIETITITSEQVAEFQRKQAESERQAMTDAAQKIAELAQSLGVEIVGVSQLIQIAPGMQGIASSWGVQRIRRP